MQDGPLISAFNATLARLSEIEKALAAVDAQKGALLKERLVLLHDLAQARLVIAHLGKPFTAATESSDETYVSRAPRRRPIRDKSSVGWARRVLRTARRPLHIDEILKLITQMSGLPVSKATLVSNLSRYVKAHDTFVRTEPNTYGLLENGEDEQKEIRLVG